MTPCLAGQIIEIANSPLDWDFLIQSAAANSVTPLVARYLLDHVSDNIESGRARQLHAALRASTVRCLVLTQQLIRLMDAFRAQGIVAIPYKGPVLALQAYGDITLREYGDLDIVLPHREIARANDVMLGLGYHPTFPFAISPAKISRVVPGEYNYRDESGRVVADLHTERTLRHFPKPPNLEELAYRLVPVEVAGHSMSTFSLEDRFPILCIHGSKDFWQRIIWIADIAELIRSHPVLDWDLVVRRAESLEAGRMLRLGLALAQKLLDADLPREIAGWVARDTFADSAANKMASRHLSREGARLGAADRFEFRRQMLPSTLDGLRYSIRLAITPADDDWSALRLPRPLSPLYRALRPLRLVGKYGWSAPTLARDAEYSDSSAKN